MCCLLRKGQVQLGILDISSLVTFLYFEDLPKARSFFEDSLGLELTYDTGWAHIFKAGPGAFIGTVDKDRASVDTSGSVLISFNVDDVSIWHKRLEDVQMKGLSEIKSSSNSGVKSFFFKGPEGYDFEVQEFIDPEAKKRFTP